MRTPESIVISGVPASPGIAIGSVHLFEQEELHIGDRDISADLVEQEVERFKAGLVSTREEIEQIRETIRAELGDEQAKIFDAHLMILDDVTALEETMRAIREELKTAEFAYRRTLSRVAEEFDVAEDEHFRNTAADVRDVKRRVIRHLLGKPRPSLGNIEGQIVLVAHDLTPSEAAMLSKDVVLGIATDSGGRTSHAAIMARSRGIPAVVGLKYATLHIRQGDTVVVDGNRGKLDVNPSPDDLDEYARRQKQFLALENSLLVDRELPAVTPDGRQLELSANIEMPEEAELALARGARGIGLYRTEFFYMRSARLPEEDEQYEAYRKVAELVSPHPAIIRTVDVGGDKFASYLGTRRENNPFLGWRGIRFSLEREEIFKVQLRAIFRAGVSGNVKLMFPMISSLDELRQANALCKQAREELRSSGVPFGENCEIGIMVETPAAVLIADSLAREADFFSIGTNDLIQYTLAVDRGNEKIAHLYDPFHPAILRSIKTLVDAGHRQDIWVGVCGEMCGDPVSAVILLGLGLDEFSTSPYLLPEIKTVIRSVSFAEAKALAEKALRLSTAADVRSFVEERIVRKFPHVLFP
ncbi:MAG: phosphoenolpyruvate--protein phosphotransferase [Candidatus Eiseniibacteriota bacterium]|nr:MAG: phosphoenolpyruvate--protein phosphotransferase [Candidatus Eisenbacteria bacterium]